MMASPAAHPDRPSRRGVVLVLSLAVALSWLWPGLPARAQGSGEDSATGSTDLPADQGWEVISTERFYSPGSYGGHNQVIAHNHADGQMLMRGRVDLQHLPGPSAAPVNYAEAIGACVGCQTLAVALQIDLISLDATTVAPTNTAVALNYGCSGCFTSARALQYVVQVEDPNHVPQRASDLVRAMNAELRAVEHSPNMTVSEAQARIDSVVAEFSDLAAYLREQRQEAQGTDSPGAVAPIFTLIRQENQ